MRIGGAAVAEEIWKTTTNEAKAEEVFIVLLVCLNTFTKSCLLLCLSTLPFLQKDTPKHSVEPYIFVKRRRFLFHYQLELAVQGNAEDTFPQSVFPSGRSWHPEACVSGSTAVAAACYSNISHLAKAHV